MSLMRARTRHMSPLQRSHARVQGLASAAFFGLLLVGLLAGCGQGGGGGGTSPSSPPTTVTQTVGSAGGTVSLPDGSVVTIDSGVLKDGTQVTVSSSTTDPFTVPEGMQAISKTVSVEVSAAGLSSTLGDNQTISIEIPQANATSSSFSSLVRLMFPREALAQIGILSDIFRSIKASVQIGSDIVTYYAPDSASEALKLARKSLLKFTFKRLLGVPPGAETAVKLAVAVYNIQLCFPDNMQIYELHNGSFRPSIVWNNTKTPLILLHGWQESSSKKCSKPYETTWSDSGTQRFADLFINDSDLGSKFQVFSVHYNTMKDIFSSNGPGLATLLHQTFGQTPVIILAHSMGGLVARSAVAPPSNVNPANIALLITLATPHHGTPLASKEAYDILRNPVLQFLEFVVGIASANPSNLLSDRSGEGFKDANHDSFDGRQFTNLRVPSQMGNHDLVALQARESQRSLHSQYVALAGQVQEPTIGAVLRDLGYENDMIIPTPSAQFDGAALKQRSLFQGLSHSSILDMGANRGMPGKDVYAAIKAALMEFTPPLPPPSTFTLTVTVNGPGTVTGPNGINCVGGNAPCPFSIASGTTLMLTILMPTPGATFVGWSGACTGTGTCTVAMTEDQSVTATFTLIPNQGTVQGTVRDFAANSGISSATLTFRNSLSGVVGTATTGSTGQYSLSLPAGTYEATVSASAYITTTVTVEVQANQTRTADVALLVQQTGSPTGGASGRIDDAITGGAVDGARVELRSGVNNRTGLVVASTTTDAQGNYSFTSIVAGTYTATVSKTGYLTNSFTVGVVGGEIRSGQNGTLSPVLATGEMRIVLTWGAIPADLDSHLTGPTPGSTSRFHVYFGEGGSLISTPFANLDRDDVTSFGPETVTIAQRFAGTYRYSVHDFTNRSSTTSSALSESGAQVKVFVAGSTAPTTFNVPPGTAGTLWTVFEMDGTTGAITQVNTMTFASSSSTIASLTASSGSPAGTEDLQLFRSLPPK